MSRGLWLLGLLYLLPAHSQTAVPKLRLPDAVQPVRYVVDLKLLPGEDPFEGRIDIEVDVRRPTSVIWIHANALEIQSVHFQSPSSTTAMNADAHENDLVGLRSPAPLPPGRGSIHISYRGQVSRILTDGLFQQRYNGDWYLFSKFEPVTARRAFPCFDEPSFKTPWRITLHVPEKLRAFSNAPMMSEEPESGGLKAVKFAESKPLPSYLVALAVGPFDVVDAGKAGRNGVPLRIIVPRGRAAEAASAAAQSPKIVEALERYFAVPFPYEKLDQVAVPLTTAWGAMENAGMIAYGSSLLLTPPQQDTEVRERDRVSVMAHEISHQWFGDLVTTAWWNDIWLNEAFASWLSSKMLMELRPDWKVNLDAAVSRNSAMNSDKLVSARTIRQPIEVPGDIANAFDGITYVKGSAVIRMFENYLGAGVFQRGVQLFLARHAWKNADANDFLAALNTAAGKDVGSLFSSFLNQGGTPLLHIDVSCGAKSAPVVHLRQERYLPLGSEGSTQSIWKIPVCLTRSAGTAAERQCVTVTRQSQDFVLEGSKECPSWVMSNQNGAGYYRTAYDGPWLAKLMRNGMPQLNTSEQLGILNDTSALFSGGLLNAADALGTSVRFAGDPDRHIVQATIGMIAAAAELTPPEYRPNLGRLIQSAYGARARSLGWSPKSGESGDDRLLRPALLPLVAISGADTALRDEGTRLATAWLDDRQAVDPDLVATALSIAAWNGDKVFFNRLVAELRRSKLQRERIQIVSGLKSFGDPALARSALELLFARDLEPRELTSLLTPSRKETRPVVWDFVKSHFDELNARLPGARGIPFAAQLPLTAAGFCTEQQRRDVESFFSGRMEKLKGGMRNLASTVENIRLCEKRTAALQPGIISFLKPY
ncbi:MAG: M1 family aminopeptidase [Bryobacteraceae bacterium]